MSLTRYWFEFEGAASDMSVPDDIRAFGCGVAAFGRDDALKVLEESVFKSMPMPDVRMITENVSIESLEENHVRPNIGDPNIRGVWFPLGFTHFRTWDG
jgi:hypothetical protein